MDDPEKRLADLRERQMEMIRTLANYGRPETRDQHREALALADKLGAVQAEINVLSGATKQ